MKLSRLLLPALAAFAFAASASAQTVISSVPYTIRVSGKYQLGANLVTASADQIAITVIAPNVILDLAGFFVSGPGNGSVSSVPGILIGNVSNVAIRNGTIANNYAGIQFAGGTDSINHLVEDLNITRSSSTGIYFGGNSSGSIVRRNVITQTGPDAMSNAATAAIETSGGVRVEKNVIVDVTGSGTGRTYGIFSISSRDFMIANTVSNGRSGSGGGGVFGIAGGKYQRNLVLNFGTAFSGGTDAGGNF